MAFGRKLFGGGKLDVSHIMKADGTCKSHARLAAFPWLPSHSYYLSVSGTYSSVDESVCRVEWDEVWVKAVGDKNNDEPYASISGVPDTLETTIIRNIG